MIYKYLEFLEIFSKCGLIERGFDEYEERFG